MWKSVEKLKDHLKKRLLGATLQKRRTQTEVFAVEGRNPNLEAGVDGFGFQGQDAEDAFVDASEGFIADESFKGFDAQGEFAQS